MNNGSSIVKLPSLQTASGRKDFPNRIHAVPRRADLRGIRMYSASKTILDEKINNIIFSDI